MDSLWSLMFLAAGLTYAAALGPLGERGALVLVLVARLNAVVDDSRCQTG
mgnify:CR=1 FL=1